MENATQQHSGRSGDAVQENDALQRFADRYGISLNQARNLVARFGNDRATLDREAVKLEGERLASGRYSLVAVTGSDRD